VRKNLKLIKMEFIHKKKITYEELLGKPIYSDNPIEQLVNQGTYILGIDNYPDNEVVPLNVKEVKNCLRIIIKRTMKKQKK